MTDYKGIKYRPELNKRNEWLSKIKNTPVKDSFIIAAKRINNEKNKERDNYDFRIRGKLRKSFKHAEELEEDDLFIGMLGELIVATEYGLVTYWLNEQKNQIEKIKRFGIFDTTDIGRTQIRTSNHNGKMVSILVRPKDFLSKAGQPIIGCVYYPKIKSMKICGWTTLQEIENRPNVQFGSFGGDGTPCFYEAPYNLNRMSTFDESFFT